MSEELKSCPFCGGSCDPKGWLRNDGVRGPECEDCGASAPNVARWNTRPLPVGVGGGSVPLSQPPGWRADFNEPLTQEQLRQLYGIKDKPLIPIGEEELFELISVFNTSNPDRFYDPKVMAEDRQLAHDICAKFGRPALEPLDEEAKAEIEDCIRHYVDDDEDVSKIMNLINKFGSKAAITKNTCQHIPELDADTALLHCKKCGERI